MAVNLNKPVNLQKRPVKKTAATAAPAKPVAVPKKPSAMSKVMPKVKAEAQDLKLRLKGAPPMKSHPAAPLAVESRRAKKK